jgi:hypothetical protein
MKASAWNDKNILEKLLGLLGIDWNDSGKAAIVQHPGKWAQVNWCNNLIPELVTLDDWVMVYF